MMEEELETIIGGGTEPGTDSEIHEGEAGDETQTDAGETGAGDEGYGGGSGEENEEWSGEIPEPEHISDPPALPVINNPVNEEEPEEIWWVSEVQEVEAETFEVAPEETEEDAETDAIPSEVQPTLEETTELNAIKVEEVNVTEFKDVVMPLAHVATLIAVLVGIVVFVATRLATQTKRPVIRGVKKIKKVKRIA